MKITKLTVGKGRTIKPGQLTYYELEGTIDDESELEVARANMEGLINGWLSVPVAPSAPAQPAATATPNIFPKDLADLLTFEYTPEWTLIRPRRYLGKENFAKIAGIVKEAGGEYISAGKESHFRISRKPGK